MKLTSNMLPKIHVSEFGCFFKICKNGNFVEIDKMIFDIAMTNNVVFKIIHFQFAKT